MPICFGFVARKVAVAGPGQRFDESPMSYVLSSVFDPSAAYATTARDSRTIDTAIARRVWEDTRNLHEAQINSRRKREESWLAQQFQTFAARTGTNSKEMQRCGVTPPDNWLEPYEIDGAALDRVGTPPKYRIRPYNLSRELLRLYRFAPELLEPGAAPMSVLDLSSGACALAELLPHLGHSVTLSDFETGAGSRYGLIHDTLAVQPVRFDGRQRPFPFSDQCADVVTCFQAFDAYATHPTAYPDILRELTRLARRKVVIVWNGTHLGSPDSSKWVEDVLGHVADFQFGRCFDTTLLGAVWTRP